MCAAPSRCRMVHLDFRSGLDLCLTFEVWSRGAAHKRLTSMGGVKILLTGATGGKGLLARSASWKARCCSSKCMAASWASSAGTEQVSSMAVPQIPEEGRLRLTREMKDDLRVGGSTLLGEVTRLGEVGSRSWCRVKRGDVGDLVGVAAREVQLDLKTRILGFRSIEWSTAEKNRCQRRPKKVAARGDV
jgi:hypothetical protein